MFRKFLPVLLLFVTSIAAAQNGTIAGVVTDATSGETVIGANVVIQGTTVGAATDIEGKFSIPNVKPGTYNLQVTFVTYKAHLIPDVIVESGKITSIQVQMQEDVSELQEVVITGTREINNDISLISAIRESKLVVSGISAEQIVRLPDKDVAQVAQRVPGITIVENRFVMVRGVPERYNQVMINGAIAPSTEIEKRSFSFDLVPANSLDQLLIYKSGAAELPGDFAGGVIQMLTKNASDEEFISFGLNVGFRNNTTFRDYNQSKGSSTDFLGFDNGFRELPSDFPSDVVLSSQPLSSKIRENAGKSLENTFDYSTRTAPVDYGFNFTIARSPKIFGISANNLTSLSYSNSYQYFAQDFVRYNDRRLEQNATPVFQFQFNDDVYAKENKINLVHNWNLKISDRVKVDFKNLFVQIGENQTYLRTGQNFYEQAGNEQNNGAYRYLSRMIYTGQLQTDITSANEANTYSIVVGANIIDRNEPDYRRYRRVRPQGTNEPFEMIVSTTSPIDAGRFYSTLEDRGYSHGFNFTRKFGNVDDKRTATLKAGYYGEIKRRDFSARYVNYSLPGTFFNDFDEYQRYLRLPLDEIFDAENLFSNSPNDTNFQPGFAIQETLRANNNYTGENTYAAGYVSGTFPVGKFDLSAGFRLEHNIQKLNSQDDTGPVRVDNPVTSPLPFVNIAFNLSERSLLRTAYSRTVNRPEFRELAPFQYYQFELDANAQGNPDLETATIDNFDLRWEMYPNAGEMVSFGGFYKSFTNPIEMVLVNVGGLGQNFSYQNAPEAFTYGVELEVKKSLSSLSVSKFFHNTSVNLNASVIQSEVNINDISGFQRQTRNLQGQSPYVINAGLYYADDKGFTANVAYNVFGKRIVAVGSVILPTWWELPRHTVDLQLAKTFGKTEMKLSVANLLNYQYRIFQDDNLDQKIEDGLDQYIRRFRTGQLITLGASWKFSKQ